MSDLEERDEWLARERCRHCKKRGNPRKCQRIVTKTRYGWRCHGFVSRYAGQRRAASGEAE